MAAVRVNARLIRFGIFAAVLILCGYILSRGSSSAYVKPSSAIKAGTPKAASPKAAEAGTPAKKNTTPEDGSKKEKATFVTLARNTDLWDIMGSIRQIEDRFNHKYHYDWVFLNDEEFNDEFIEVTSGMISGNTKYGLIPHEHWSFPPWIDTEKAAAVREQMRKDKVIYGDSISYRHMCRFESGFFYRNELMQEYEWYWRVEPGIKIFCDVDYDPFKYMAENNLKYGFTISLPEYGATIPTLWDTTKEFIKANPQYIPEENLIEFISDDGGYSYNGCHFWSNFEIANLEIWRSEAYTKYFEHLDQAGGFFYERWGDAPVHSIAASLFLPKGSVHFFDDIGYYHVPFNNCPIEPEVRKGKNCYCDPSREETKDFTWTGYSCTGKFFNVMGLKKPSGWEKYN